MLETGHAAALDGAFPAVGSITAADGVTITHVAVPAMASIIARKDKADEIAARVAERWGIELPRTPRVASAGGLSLAWAGHQQWLAKSETDQGAELEDRLRGELGALASISDQSDNRVLVRIEGPKARELLAHGLPIDLHPNALKSGDLALTLFGYIGVHVWVTADTPTFDLFVPRSYASSFWRTLMHAAH